MEEIIKLREELKRYRDLLDNMPDVIQSVNANGSIVFVNKRATELFGYTKEELLSMMIDDLYAPDFWKDVGMGFQKLIKEGTNFNVKTAVIAKSGERVDVEVNSIAYRDDKNNFVGTISVLRDIRGRK